MMEKIMVQFLFEGDYRAWEQIKPVVFEELEFDLSQGNRITDELFGYFKTYNVLNPVKLEQIRWQWGTIGQGHYIGSWMMR